MKGKKIDKEFVSKYLENSINYGFSSINEILEITKARLETIDFHLSNIENIKKQRSKLVDVLSMFDKASKKNNNTKADLDFFNIRNLNHCLKICSNIDSINNVDLSDIRIVFTIKELISLNILAYDENNILVKDVNFEKFMIFLNGIFIWRDLRMA